MITCVNCNHTITEKFCSACGHPAVVKKIDKHYISHEIFHLLHVEKGFLYTAKELMMAPGKAIRQYISTDRTKHMKPVAFLIFASLIFTVTAHLMHTDEIYNEKEKLAFGKSSIGIIMQWVQTHYGYANIIMGGFIALCVQLFFRKYRYNIFEITVVLCFVMGQAMLLLTIENLLIKIMNAQVYKIILVVISVAYPTWAIGQFFDKRKISSYLKSFIAYVTGYILFYIAIIIVGLTTDMILKMFATH